MQTWNNVLTCNCHKRLKFDVGSRRATDLLELGCASLLVETLLVLKVLVNGVVQTPSVNTLELQGGCWIQQRPWTQQPILSTS